MTTGTATHDEAKAMVEMLVRALEDLGLAAEPFGANMVWAANRSADPPCHPIAAQMSPGMRQTVLCRANGNGRLAWWWIWTATDGAPEYEWLCPAAEINVAAVKIARVLAVRPETVS
jgi:hypothetical protein